MTIPIRRRSISRGLRSHLSLEALEPRVNLSAAATGIPPVAATFGEPAQIISSTSPGKVTALPPLPAMAELLSGPIAIPVASYTVISNCSLELQAGQTQSDIGYVSASGAYVDYDVSAAAAGTYSLSLGVASPGGAMVQVLVNGSAQATIGAAATNSWSSYTTGTASIQLAAGDNIIRLASENATQYNINAITLVPPAAPATPVIAVGDDTILSIAAYSAIDHSKLEHQSTGPDIGYVSRAGAYVEYTLNVQTAGTYTLTAGVADLSSSTFDVSSGGVTLASFTVAGTGSWRSYSSFSQSVVLGAGEQVLRFTATNGSQYNLNALQLVRQIPAIAPAAAAITGSAGAGAGPTATIAVASMGSLQRLVITGTAGDDFIIVSQSGNTLTIMDNGTVSTVSGTFGEIAIYCVSGNDTVTVQSSVSITCLLYGGNGNDILTAAGSAQSYIVTVGSSGVHTLTGNGVNTALWCTSADILNVSSAEVAGGDIHQVNSFYGGVSTTLAGQTLPEPSDSGTMANYANQSLFGAAPSVLDVNQGQVGDCYFLASIQSFAAEFPARLEQMAVDLGDGTYAVQFVRNGVDTFVRVDGNLPVAPWGGFLNASPDGNGAIWACIMEKAYAFFRTGAGTYASLNSGWTGSVYNDLGVANTTFSAGGNGTALFNTITTALANDKAVSIITLTTIVGGAPLVGSHAYSILGTSIDGNGVMWFTFRNPWGLNGGGSVDPNGGGLVQVTLAQLQANCSAGSISV